MFVEVVEMQYIKEKLTSNIAVFIYPYSNQNELGNTKYRVAYRLIIFYEITFTLTINYRLMKLVTQNIPLPDVYVRKRYM